ncbi:amidohydrolase family protein, partial [Acidimicrobiaceae bacterium USS-CC1]|nr:amidohydrolase family protein [Acidiferrimicrobium australe]
VTDVWSLPYARRPGSAAGLNAASAALAADPPGDLRVVGGATVHPGDDDPAGLVRAAIEELGLRVLKLHCSVGDYRPDDVRLDAVWSYASDLRLPVVVHAGHAVSGHTGAGELEPVATVARRWPEVPLVLAHCGHPATAEAWGLVASHPGVHVDLTPVVHDAVPLDAAVIAAHAERVLFGSDAPNTAWSVPELVGRLRRLDLAAPALDAVLGGNARRLQDRLRV